MNAEELIKTDLLNSFPEKKTKDKEWLINVVSGEDISLTSGNYKDYKEYACLIDYYEEINLVSSQNTGIKGICFSNVKITLNRSDNSKKILDQFLKNNIMNQVNLLQVYMKKTLKKAACISYKTCKFINVKSFLNYCEFYFQYASRSEQYYLSDELGNDSGVV